MKKSPFVIWFLLLLFLFNGCNLDDLDFNKLSGEVNLNPEFVAPVAKGTISVWDMVQSANKENDDVITKDQNGLLKIVYKQNDLFNYDVGKFLVFPDQQKFPSEDKVLGVISPDDVIISSSIKLSDLVDIMKPSLDAIKPLDGLSFPFPAILFPGPAANFNNNEQVTDFTSLSLSKGYLEVIIDNKLKVPVTIQGDLFDKINNRAIKEFTFTNIAPNGTDKSTLFSLAGTVLSNQIEFRLKRFETTGSATPVLINLTDFFKLTFNLTGLGISRGNLMIKKPQTLESSLGTFGFDFPDQPDMKAFGAVLKSGSIIIKTINTSPLTGTVNFTLSEIKKNGIPITASIPLSGNSTTINLDNAVIDFSKDPAKPYNQIPYTYSLRVNESVGYINYSSTDVVKMEITLNNLQFQSVTGDFGKRAIQVDPGLFDMNVDLLDKIDGSFKLANPTLELTIHNSIGMPAKVDLDFTATNKAGITAALNPPVFDLPVPANINSGIATKGIVFDKNNSNIVNFIALPPTGQISYSGKVDFNTSSTPITPQNPNFLDLDATFAIDMTMELPLELQISNLTFKDTISISGGNFDKLETAELILKANNGIPLDIDMQLFFVDTISKKQFGASKKTKILTAAQVNASGVITPTQSLNTFGLDKGEMENLRKANGIVFSGSVSSPASGATAAPIRSDSKIELNVVIKSKVNL